MYVETLGTTMYEPDTTPFWIVTGRESSSYGYAGTQDMTDEEKEAARLREERRATGVEWIGFVPNLTRGLNIP